jgi:MFS transporter, FHS family, Na+ dependent glucose transporter 1
MNDVNTGTSTTSIPSVLSSVSLFITFLFFGACVASLGASIPALERVYGRSIGIAFTTRGAGNLLGSLVSGSVVEGVTWKKIDKTLVGCLCGLLTGLSTGLITATTNYDALLSLFFFQGIGFGAMDTMCNCAIAELWGSRVQPWMQALHALFGVGAVIGPALVGGFGFENTFIALAVLSCVPIVNYAAVYWSLSSPPTYIVEAEVEVETQYKECASEANIEQAVSDNCENTTTGVPLMIRATLAAFFFIYVGAETGFGGWVATFALQIGDSSSESEAAFLSAVFWASLAGGRIVAIPTALYLTTTTMLRLQLSLTVVGVLLGLFLAPISYGYACVASAVFGFALSSIFPLAMTIVGEYGFKMDTVSTTLFVVAACAGESIIPVLLGVLIDEFGPMILPYSMLLVAVLLISFYSVTHWLAQGRVSVVEKDVIEAS